MLTFTVDGDPAAPALVLGPALGTTRRVWSPQTAALARDFRVIRFDLPGHTGEPDRDHPRTIAGLAADLLRELTERGVESFHYCGISIGGAIGQQLATDCPDRVRRLVLVCTSATFGDSPRPWLERAARVRAEGTGFLPALARDRWFGPGGTVPPLGADLLAGQTRIDPEGYAAGCEALAAFDSRAWLGRIASPTRVIAGERDRATPTIMSEELRAGIPGADLVVVPEAGHLAPVERPEEVLRAVREHLGPV